MKFILSDLKLDKKRAITCIPPVPDTSAGKRACNMCLKNGCGEEYDKNWIQITLAQKQRSKCAQFFCITV